MFGLIHTLGLLLSWLAPKEKDHFAALTVYHFNHMVCELLPATFGMRVGFAVLNGQRGIQEENSLFSPFGKISVSGCLGNVFERDEVFVHIFERRRRRNWLENTEAEAMGLVGLMIGILSDDDNLDTGDGSGSEGIEDVFHFGVDLNEKEITFLPD